MADAKNPYTVRATVTFAEGAVSLFNTEVVQAIVDISVRAETPYSAQIIAENALKAKGAKEVHIEENGVRYG